MNVELVIDRYDRHLDVKITMPPVASRMDGQCGNNNGNDEDDSETSIKERLGDLHVQSQESLFRSARLLSAARARVLSFQAASANDADAGR